MLSVLVMMAPGPQACADQSVALQVALSRSARPVPQVFNSLLPMKLGVLERA
jgi:hypothetical protein